MPRSSPPPSNQNSDSDDDTVDSKGRASHAQRQVSSNQPPPLPPQNESVTKGHRSSLFSTSDINIDDDVAQSDVPGPQTSSTTDAAKHVATPVATETFTETALDDSMANVRSAKERKRASIETESGSLKKHAQVRLPFKRRKLSGLSKLLVEAKQARAKASQPSTEPIEATSISAVTPTPTRLELGAFSFGSDSKENHESPSSSCASSNKSQLSTTNHPVPEGVTQLYPPRRSIAHLYCQCQQNDHCSSDSVSLNYVLTYGWDHNQLLRRSESAPHVPAPSPLQRRSSESSSSHHSQGSEAGHSEATPKGGVAWVVPRRRPRNDNDSASAVVESNYLARQPDLTPKMRAILIDWLIELSEEYNVSPASLHLAITLVDKSLASGPPNEEINYAHGGLRAGLVVTRTMLQCLGCACLWIACKMEEVEPPSVEDFVYISDNSYPSQQIINMEMSVCEALRFRLWQVTPFQFVYEFLRASHACSNPGCLPTSHNHVLRNMVLYLIEIARVPYELCGRSPSLIAAAAVYLARATLGMRDAAHAADTSGIWTLTLLHYTGYSVDQLKETVSLIHQHHRVAGEGSLKQVFAKFLKEKYFRVSLKTALNAEDLGFAM